MSTHCGIAVKTDKGYETIYCHHNGMPSRMYPMLRDNYGTEELANKLISFGDASSIRENLIPTRGHHSFDNPEKGVCVFYCRDRGEKAFDTRPCPYDTKKDVLDRYYYAYIFENGKWTAYTDNIEVIINECIFG